MSTDATLLFFLVLGVVSVAVTKLYASLNTIDAFLLLSGVIVSVFVGLVIAIEFFSRYGKDKRKRTSEIREIPNCLLMKDPTSICIGIDANLKIPIYLPDAVRMRHVHIIGATGTGKSESVNLNFLKQDVARGLGAIILDAKGDSSFYRALKSFVPEDRLKMFDLGSPESMKYNPLAAGSPLESSQRLFSSLTWSEEYYKSKALSAVQRLFQNHFDAHEKNPNISDISDYLEDPDSYISATLSDTYPVKLAGRDFMELSGLRDQIKSLCTGHLSKILSPNETSDMNLEDASRGVVLYFRLQSLMSPQLVSTLGKLIINHLNFLAGSAHRELSATVKSPSIIPTYLDEFASFACPEFADLISKARSAGLALHFSHQSIGDLAEVQKGFLNRLTDNSATKIVLRINDPDTAEFFSRSFGTKIYQKVTQRVTNAEEIESAELVGEGSQREAHQFRASPDQFKTLATGVGSVLIAHGFETPHGASTVFKIRFPRLE
jgi:conjugal transfer pilus assembly protein TraD